MKPSFESLDTLGLSSFLVRKFEEKSFSAPYHFHPECELTFIVNGSGKRYVGTHMQEFQPGDFVLLGANQPHCWKSEPRHETDTASSLVIQFQQDFLGKDFFEKPEITRIAQLLQSSRHGIRFTHHTETYHSHMMQLTEEKNSCQRTLLLLQLLHTLSLDTNYLWLDKQAAGTLHSPAEQQRIHAAMTYIIENFKGQVSLSKAAAAVNMTPHSFCKYFKRLTRKTFGEAVTGYRIDYAAQQLIHTGNSISQICYDSGFNDVSNFHKTFKARMGLSPLRYRHSFLAH